MTTEQVVGKYQWKGFHDVYSSIEIKKDSTFEFNWQQGLADGTTFGTWTKKGNIIILKSELQPAKSGATDYEVFKTESINSDSLTIVVTDHECEPLPFANCRFKTNSTVISETSTNRQGQVNFRLQEADSLIISFLGYQTIRYPIDIGKTRYEFKMKENNEMYRYFTNEAWILKDNRLNDPSIQTGEYVKKYYHEKNE